MIELIKPTRSHGRVSVRLVFFCFDLIAMIIMFIWFLTCACHVHVHTAHVTLVLVCDIIRTVHVQ